MDAQRLELTLGWPPTVNHYWHKNGNRFFIAANGVAYRQSVRIAVNALPAPLQAFLGEVALEIKAYPPDRRRRDLDNLLKSLLDSLAHAGVYIDDNQVSKITIERAIVAPKGRLDVTITSFSPLSDSHI